MAIEADVKREIDWFNKQVDLVGEFFKSALKVSESKTATIVKNEVELNEQLSGTYKSNKIRFDVPGYPSFSIVPVAIWVTGARGRIEIEGPSGSEVLVYYMAGGPVLKERQFTGNSLVRETVSKFLEGVDKEGWYWYSDSSIKKSPRLLDENTVLEIMERIDL